jgi:cell wall-associated NlpC family hydrolase
MLLNHETIEAFKDHVLKCYPEEACGIVQNDVYIPMKNVSEDPLHQFEIDGSERFELEKIAPIQCILHSHPYKLADSKKFREDHYHPVWASVTDQESWMNDNVPWGIVATDGEGISRFEWLEDEMKPFDKREFSWFTADCYTCVRDWHRDHTKIIAPNFTREFGFWLKGQNTIEEGIQTIPFATIHNVADAHIGDIAVFAIGQTVVNHLGVISGQNQILHQFVERYPEHARWDVWSKRAKYLVRFNK